MQYTRALNDTCRRSFERTGPLSFNDNITLNRHAEENASHWDIKTGKGNVSFSVPRRSRFV